MGQDERHDALCEVDGERTCDIHGYVQARRLRHGIAADGYEDEGCRTDAERCDLHALRVHADRLGDERRRGEGVRPRRALHGERRHHSLPVLDEELFAAAGAADACDIHGYVQARRLRYGARADRDKGRWRRACAGRRALHARRLHADGLGHERRRGEDVRPRRVLYGERLHNSLPVLDGERAAGARDLHRDVQPRRLRHGARADGD